MATPGGSNSAPGRVRALAEQVLAEKRAEHQQASELQTQQPGAQDQLHHSVEAPQQQAERALKNEAEEALQRQGDLAQSLKEEEQLLRRKTRSQTRLESQPPQVATPRSQPILPAQARGEASSASAPDAINRGVGSNRKRAREPTAEHEYFCDRFLYHTR